MKVTLDKENGQLPRLASKYGMSQPDKLVTMKLPDGNIVGLK
jgi:hypothetical protein